MPRSSFRRPPRAATAPLGRPATARLAAEGPRTIPFRLEEVTAAPPPGFSRERFSPRSRMIKAGRRSFELIQTPRETLGAALPLVYAELLRITAENTPYHAGTYMHRHLAEASCLIVVRQDGIPRGFSIASDHDVDGEAVLYMNATMFSPELRGGGLTASVNWLHCVRAALRHFPRGFHIAVRTQNPLVLAACLSCAPFYPRPGAAVPAEIQATATALAAKLSPGCPFDAAALVQRGAVARDAREAERPRHHDPALNQLFDDHLDYEGGDLFLLMGPMSWVRAIGLALGALGARQPRRARRAAASS